MNLPTTTNSNPIAIANTLHDDRNRQTMTGRHANGKFAKGNHYGRRGDGAIRLRQQLLDALNDGKALQALDAALVKQPAAVLNLASRLLPSQLEVSVREVPSEVVIDTVGVVRVVETE